MNNLQIERVYCKNANLENILESIIDANLDKNFKEFLNNVLGQPDVENTSNADYNTNEKIDCVAQNYKKGGTH